MSGFLTMMKMNLILLLRNKGYLAFLIILPIISVLMLNANTLNSSDEQENSYVIQELSSANQSIINLTNEKLNVKVYDCSNTKLSNYILEELAKTGAYRIYRYKGDTMDVNEAREKALTSVNHSIVGAVIYIPDTFESEVLHGNDSNMVVFEASKDGRIELLEKNINAYQQSLYQYAALTNYSKEELIKLLDTSVKNEISKEKISIEVGNTLNLAAEQKEQSSNIGYSLSFLTIGFLFIGVFIAATVVEERQNRVYNRVVLSQTSLGNYAFVKLLIIFITVLLQTGIIAIAIPILVKKDFGIPFVSYLFFVFCLGLVFNILSVVIGVLTNNVLTSNYIVFLIWTLSSLLAGLYFPLDGASKWWIRVRMLMPQSWVVKASEMLMAGKSGVYGMFLFVILSYLTILMCVGFIGVKIIRKE